MDNRIQKEKSSIEETYKYITSIVNELQSKNRFFTDKKFLGYLDAIFKEAERSISPRHVFYRARRFPRNKINKEKLETQFEGYDSENSFVNKASKWPNYSRMNPQGISVLYIASDIRTAITELHPYSTEVYSVATIKNVEPLSIVDLSEGVSDLNDDFTRHLAIYVQNWISQGSEEKDYVFPQYIASYCEHLGYDGIGYRSKYATKDNIKNKEGVNYTIFNYSKCEVMSSKLYEIHNVAVRTAPIGKRDN